MPPKKKKKRPPKKPNQTEYSMTVGMTGEGGKERYFNVPTVERRSQVLLTPQEAVYRAAVAGLLGQGYQTLEQALNEAQARHEWLERAMLTNEGKAPQVTGRRVPRYWQMIGQTTPFNPGGAQPRGGGGYPDFLTSMLLSNTGGIP